MKFVDGLALSVLIPLLIIAAILCMIVATYDWAKDRGRLALRKMRILAGVPVVFVVACGGSAVEQHHTASQATAVAIEITAGGIEGACTPVEDVGPEKARRCVRAFEAHDALRAAWMLWVRTVAASEDEYEWINAALSLLPVYREVAALLQELGVAAPPVPSFLDGLTGD